MKKTVTMSVLALLLLSAFSASSTAEAYGGNGQGNRGNEKEQGMRGMGYGLMQHDAQLLSHEEREAFRESSWKKMRDMSVDERRAFAGERREAMQTMRDSKRAELESFVGLTHAELLGLHRDGYTFEEILEQQGVSENEAEAFLIQRLETQVDMITERHDLDTEEEETLREKISTVVNRILERWFGA